MKATINNKNETKIWKPYYIKARREGRWQEPIYKAIWQICGLLMGFKSNCYSNLQPLSSNAIQQMILSLPLWTNFMIFDRDRIVVQPHETRSNSKVFFYTLRCVTLHYVSNCHIIHTFVCKLVIQRSCYFTLLYVTLRYFTIRYFTLR